MAWQAKKSDHASGRAACLGGGLDIPGKLHIPKISATLIKHVGVSSQDGFPINNIGQRLDKE